MIWQDMFVDRFLSKTEIRAGLAALFGTLPDDVSVVTHTEASTVRIYSHVICETYIVEAAFPMQLTIYYDQTALVPPSEYASATGELCERWKCQALIPDETPLPSSMWLVRDPSDRERVEVDSDVYDAGEEYEAEE